MNAIRLHAAGKLQRHVEALPAPQPGEALVKMRAVGVCGSDLHWFAEAGIGDANLIRPLVLGHEMAGVAESGQYAGKLVAVDPSIPCGSCEFCLQGNPNLCPYQRFAGVMEEDGGLREYIAWPEKCLFPMPHGFTAADGVMLEPLGVAMFATQLSQIQPSDAIGIFGSGPIGLLILQLVRLSAADLIIASDVLPHRVAAAQRLGADYTVLADDRLGVRQIRPLLPRHGLNIAIEVAGDNAAVEAAIELVKPGGRVILVGIPTDDRTSVCASQARRKGITLQWVRRMKHTYPLAINYVEQKIIDVRSMVTHAFPLQRAEQAFISAQKREGLKTIITMDGDV